MRPFSITKALRLLPDRVSLHKNVADALLAQGKLARAKMHYTAVVRAQPDNAEAHYQLAVVLVGQGEKGEAVRLSERPARLTGFKNRVVLDTLAAAYAESGRLAEAVETAQKALGLTDAAANEKLTAGIRMRLEGHRSGRPHQE